MKKVSFDFDLTLSRKDVQEYAKELIEKGIEVHIITGRFDDLHQHQYHHHPTNDDLWEVIDNLNIPRDRVHFMNHLMTKGIYLFDTDIIWHLDDDIDDLNTIKNIPKINVNYPGWKELCNKLLE